MHVVRDRNTREILFVHPARPEEALRPHQVWDAFDETTMVVETPDPDRFDYRDGRFVELTKEELIERGVIDPPPPKTLTERVKTGELRLEPTHKVAVIDGVEQVVLKSLAEQVEEGLIELPPATKLDASGARIVPMTDAEQAEAGVIDLELLKTRRIAALSERALGERAALLPDYKVLNALAGVYGDSEARVQRYRATMAGFRAALEEARGRVERAKTIKAVMAIEPDFPKVVE
ncbi:MAG: hypothetical protein RIT81_47055 [Deltaproteobacteria bacterium]